MLSIPAGIMMLQNRLTFRFWSFLIICLLFVFIKPDGTSMDGILKISFIALVVVGVICTELWSVVSWFVQFRRMFAVCFFISVIWNWFHLYMVIIFAMFILYFLLSLTWVGIPVPDLPPATGLTIPGSFLSAFAEHKKNIDSIETLYVKCTGKKEVDWMDSLTEWWRRMFTVQDDPCKKYYEVLVVNPILLVPPTKAITITITSFITDPMKHIGEGINEFLLALLKDIPVTLQIPVLLIFAVAIFVFMYSSAQATIHHAVGFPWLGWRQNPPPPAVGQQQNLHYGDVWQQGYAPQPLQMSDRLNRIVNRGGQGFSDVYTQQNTQENGHMELQQDFLSFPRGSQIKLQVMCPSMKQNWQQQTQEVEPGAKKISSGSEVKADEKEKKLSFRQWAV